MEIVRQAGTSAYYSSGEYIFYIGDAAEQVYLLESGRVILAGEHGIVQYRKAGQLLGLAEVIQGLNRSWQAVAATDTKLTVIGREDLVELLASEPFLSVKLTKQLTRRLEDKTSGAMGTAADRWVLERLAWILLKVSEGQVSGSGHGDMGTVCFSATELAAIIGTSEEAVQNALKAMGDGQSLDIQGEKITVKDREQLKRYAI